MRLQILVWLDITATQRRWVRTDCEESGRGLFAAPIQAFSWKRWDKTRKTAIRLTGVPAKTRNDDSQHEQNTFVTGWVGPSLYTVYLRCYVWRRNAAWLPTHVLGGWILTRSSHLNRDRFLFAMKYFVLYTCVYIGCDNPQQSLFYVPLRLFSCFACPWT